MKWRLMVTTLKVPKDHNSTTLEELVSSLRSHEIKLEEDEPQRKWKFVVMNSKGKPEKTKTFQVEEEDTEEGYDEEDELSPLSRRVK